MIAYDEALPEARLADWVECGWCMEAEHGMQSHSVPPDGCIDILYDRRDGSLRVIGCMTVRQSIDLPAGTYLAGVRFQPGMARAFLKVPATELTDKAIDLADISTALARELVRKVEDARSIRDAMRAMLTCLPRPDRADGVYKALHAIRHAHGAANLDDLSRSAGLSVRQFRRRCLEESGLTPKMLCRVLRFRRVLREKRSAVMPNWAALAVEAGYFDQAHLIRDFRQFMGTTPMSEFSNTR